MQRQAEVAAALDGQRIDRAVAQLLPELSRSMAQQLCEAGGILLNGKPAAKSQRVREGDSIAVYIPQPQPLEVTPEAIPLDIVYEDDDLLVVNKPKGMVVHPAAGNHSGTLVNALLAHCGDSLSGINGVIRPGIVHRIDKDTTGLLIVAKNDFSHQSLSQQIKAHSFQREYAAIVHGHFREESLQINAPIGRHPTDRKRMCVTQKNARDAVTHIQVLEPLCGFSYIKCILETGRTHQIRVHTAYMGHPVAGDMVYGPKKSPISGTQGQCLHARTIGFIHPRSGEQVNLTSPLPPYFENLLEKLRR